MKNNLILILLIFNSFSHLDSQTNSIILDNYRTANEWITPHKEVESQIDKNYSGGFKQFLTDFYKLIKLNPKNEDWWVRNYLVNLNFSKDEVSVTFENTLLKVDKKMIEEILVSTKGNWKNENSVDLNLLISFDSAEKNNLLEYSILPIKNNSLIFVPSTCDEYDCLFESKAKIEEKIKELNSIEENGAARYYQKILSIRFPFDKEVNNKLRELMKRN